MSSWRMTLLMCLAFMPIALSMVWGGDITEPKFEKYVLPNGLNVILHEDHTIPMVSVNIWYHVGALNEKPGKTGFAHIFEHMMFQGSQHRPGYFDEAIKTIGGENNGGTSMDKTEYWENVPSNYLERMLWLDADRMGYLLPEIDQKKLDIQKDVIQNERRERYDNQPYGRDYETLQALLFPKDHPYSRTGIGSMEDIGNATLEDVSEFFHKYYTPNNASLCIAGDFNPAQAKEWVEKYFGPIPSGPPIDRLNNWVPTLDGVKRASMDDNVSLPRLYMAWPTPALYQPGDAEFDILASVLSSGKSSRLYKTLVYDKQIAQDVNAYQESKILAGSFNIVVTAKEGQSLANIEKEIDLILKDILVNGITKDEFERARTNWEASFIRSLQQVGDFNGRAGRLNGYNVQLGDPGKLLWDRNRYSSATPEGVKSYANKYLKLDGRAILYTNPMPNLSVSEDSVDMSIEPVAASEPVFKPPVLQKATLKNGMNIVLVERHDLPLIQFNMLFKSGWSADPSDKVGVAGLTADLLTSGTKTKNALQISEEAQRLGANLSSQSGFDNSSVSLNVLSKNFDAGLKLMSEVITNPTFPDDELARQKNIRLGRIQQESRQPLTTAFKGYFKELYGEGHPYGQPMTGSGTAKSVAAINRDELQKFYQANYLPNNATAIIVGDITLAEAKTKLEAAFSGWKEGKLAGNEVKQVTPLAKTKIYIIDKPNAEQSAIVVGNLVTSRNNPDYRPLQVVNSILGANSTARLFMNLRQDKAYTYGSYSFVTGRRTQGALNAYAEVKTAVTKEAVAEMLKEFRGMTGPRPISDIELANGKNYLSKGYSQNFETFNDIAGQIGTLMTYNLPENEWSTYIGEINGVTGATVAASAQKYIKPDAELIVIMGDRQKIEPGLKELNVGDIVYLDPKDL
jgi:zinc protease